MSELLFDALKPPPWFGLVDVLVVVGILALIYCAYRLGPRGPWPGGPYWP